MMIFLKTTIDAQLFRDLAPLVDAHKHSPEQFWEAAELLRAEKDSTGARVISDDDVLFVLDAIAGLQSVSAGHRSLRAATLAFLEIVRRRVGLVEQLIARAQGSEGAWLC